jgi:hypothetical protein
MPEQMTLKRAELGQQIQANKEADINTVIVLFGAPADSKISNEAALQKTVNFITFYMPFEKALFCYNRRSQLKKWESPNYQSLCDLRSNSGGVI